METDSRTLRQLQRQFVIGACTLLPFSPFLYVQGQITRWKIGVLPGAAGETSGTTGAGSGVAVPETGASVGMTAHSTR